MVEIINVDSDTDFFAQLDDDGGPVTLVNTFVVPEGKYDQMVEAWRLDSEVMKAAKGFISAQLYRGIHGSRVVTNVAVWESAEDLRNAINSEGFIAVLSKYPEGTVAYPHLLRRVAVPGVCTSTS
ncbi:antibiotic biosynthesis monooxygenase family protein [Mycobacterium deserti]|uniref:Antibiotic biosynthesis monooxygenase n=1 Tax=Mycobacterium deserti TaxID=2978347 RepID=A0ABT2M993_9MYCO|nr:antibiotic biosynthesis monooxygenase family protein [Mycobacterium deserti]MCT7658000.1 antibiotic biosynthesis monooxygenase [Mycobacterium deserti]